MNRRSRHIAEKLFGADTVANFFDPELTTDFFQYQDDLKANYRNENREELRLAFELPFPESKDVDTLFQYFTNITFHGLPFVDLRDESHYMVRAQQSLSSFYCFHGVSSCLNMSLFFFEFVRILTKKTLTLCYLQHPTEAFSHVFCYDKDTQKIYDPDFKICCHKDDYGKDSSWSWYLNILEHATPSLSSELPAHFFTEPQERYIAFMMNARGREYSKKGGRKESFLRLMNESMRQGWQEIDLQANDYPWKKRYRSEIETFTKSNAQRENSKLLFRLPPQSSLSFRTKFSEENEILDTLLSIYTGRSLCVLDLVLEANQPQTILIPELPILMMSELGESLEVGTRSLKPSAHNDLYYLSPREMEVALGFFSERRDEHSQEISIQSNKTQKVSFYFLYNPKILSYLKSVVRP